MSSRLFRSASAVAAFVVALPAVLSTGTAAAAPRAVEAFGVDTWPALLGALKKPAVVVFSSTSCGNCPAVLAELADDLRRRRSEATLMAVVTDVAPGEADPYLLKQAHYRTTERLFAFDGQEQRLRHAVNPAWRGATPYVGLLRPGRPPVWVTGAPTAAEIQAWAAARP
jgi:hypothetical protein